MTQDPQASMPKDDSLKVDGAGVEAGKSFDEERGKLKADLEAKEKELKEALVKIGDLERKLAEKEKELAAKPQGPRAAAAHEEGGPPRLRPVAKGAVSTLTPKEIMLVAALRQKDKRVAHFTDSQVLQVHKMELKKIRKLRMILVPVILLLLLLSAALFYFLVMQKGLEKLLAPPPPPPLIELTDELPPQAQPKPAPVVDEAAAESEGEDGGDMDTEPAPAPLAAPADGGKRHTAAEAEEARARLEATLGNGMDADSLGKSLQAWDEYLAKYGSSLEPEALGKVKNEINRLEGLKAACQ